MGIRFLDSILSLLAVSCVVFSSYFVGHALSIDHPGTAWIIAAVLAVLGLAMGFLTIRRIRGYADPQDRNHSFPTH
ncbi:MAG TPA: hypothetical protein VMM83_07060 [Longimicrobiales bacterium]|nr:hypothetical protein [Longimicrobiales bacterium]